MIEHIPDLIAAGIDSFKIEGRMKNALYVATVCRAYRDAIDTLYDGAETTNTDTIDADIAESFETGKSTREDDASIDGQCGLKLELIDKYHEKLEWYREQVRSCTYRDFCTGFFYGKPDESAQVYEGEAYHEGRTYLGIVGDLMSNGTGGTENESPVADKPDSSQSDAKTFMLQQKNKFAVGEEIEIMGFDGADRRATVLSITDADGHPQPDAPHARQQLIVTLSAPVRPGEILRSVPF